MCDYECEVDRGNLTILLCCFEFMLLKCRNYIVRVMEVSGYISLKKRGWTTVHT